MGIEQPDPAAPGDLAARVGLLLLARERVRAAGRAPDRYAVVIDEASALLADRSRSGDHAALLRRCLAAGRGPGLPPGPGGRRSGTEG